MIKTIINNKATTNQVAKAATTSHGSKDIMDLVDSDEEQHDEPKNDVIELMDSDDDKGGNDNVSVNLLSSSNDDDEEENAS
jgi:hypothetical protein